MSTVHYIGFGDSLASLVNRLSATAGVEFKEILQLSSDVQENSLTGADVFLIGPYTLEPLRQVQRAHLQNPIISIIVLIFPDQFQKVKQAIQFSFNVGKHITFVSYELGKDISTVIEYAIIRTQQRKSFSRINNPGIPKKLSHDVTFTGISAFLERAPIGAIVFNDKKDILLASNKAKQLLYPLLEQSSVQNLSELFPHEDRLFSSLSLPDYEWVPEIVKVHNRFLEVNITPLDTAKKNAHFLLLFNDITRRVIAENQLKSKVDELEFLNHELDEFVNVVSHDFKTPLTSISLLAEMGIKESSQDKQISLLKRIKVSCDKLKELLKGLNSLVDISKTRPEKIENVNFQERLNVISAEYMDLLKDIGGKITADFSQAESMPYFTAHIDSFFSNLITNAIKYRKANVPLEIHVRSRSEKEYVILSVKDNGTGIDLSRNMIKLFQPFKRLTDQGTGTGLGLSIVKRLIERNHGYLEVFSQPGLGTEFRAYLKEQH